MKTYRPKPIKPFKTLEEEAEFWDTHDLSPLFAGKKIDLMDLPLIEKEKDASITVRIQRATKNILKKVARQKGLNPSTLARMWIMEKLNELDITETYRIRDKK